jgi:hypothetical protein
MRTLATLFVFLLVPFLGACVDDPPTAVGKGAPESEAAATQADWMVQDLPAVLAGRGISQPQAIVASDGGLVLVWRENGSTAGAGSNLYSSRRPPGGSFSEPLRINGQMDSLESWNHDENRASVALGPDQLVAVAWTTKEPSVWAAISSDGGASFAESLQLNQDEGRAYQGFTAITFDSTGVLHATWIDARGAEKEGVEEPADLYYARVEKGAVVAETNLTDAEGDGSVCGCCRPFMTADGDRLSIAFRNAPEDGFRDIYRITGDTAGSFSEPARFGPPMWELRGCPSAGPVIVGAETLWFEASTGDGRILAATDTDLSFSIVLEKEDSWKPRRPPRPVAGSADLLLVPGDPAARLIKSTNGEWTNFDTAVPVWATTAALIDGEILAIGTKDDELHLASKKSL